MTVERAQIDRVCGPSKQIIVIQKQDCGGLALVHTSGSRHFGLGTMANRTAAPARSHPGTTLPTFGGQAIYDPGRDLSSFAVTQGTDVAVSEVLFVTRS